VAITDLKKDTPPCGRTGSGRRSGRCSKPVKVFILAGQSYMEGTRPSWIGGGAQRRQGDLKALMNDRKIFQHLKNDKGQWLLRDDVRSALPSRGKQPCWRPLSIGLSVCGGKAHFGGYNSATSS
jgi:hypothetical protein